MAITYANVGGAEPSTLTFRVGTVQIARGSTNEQQEILVLGDPQTSNAIARVVAAAPLSTEFGLVVRIASGPSSAADLPVQISGNSTVMQGTSPWIIAGNSTVAPLPGSTWATRPIQSSAADLQMTATQGTNPWIIAGNSTVAPLAGSTWNTRTLQSSAADLQMTATPAAGSTWNTRTLQSSAADLQMTATQGTNPWIIAGNSTVAPLAGSTWNTRTLQSSAADLQMTATPAAGSTWNTRALQSSAADLQMTATPAAGSTWTTRTLNSSRADFLATVYQSTASEFLATVTIGTNLQSTSAPSSNSSGLTVRQVIDNILTTASTNTFSASTSFSIQSSAASIRSYVTAYSITTTNAGPTKLSFVSGSTLLWPVQLAAVSSAISGVNLAVGAPAYLFRTKVAGPLSLRTAGSTLAGFVVGVSYFRAP